MAQTLRLAGGMTVNTRRRALCAVIFVALWCGAPGHANAGPLISFGSYTPSTTMPFVVPIEITGAVNLALWQFDLAYDATDVQINTACDPVTDLFCGFLTGPVTEGPFFGSLSPFNLFSPGVILIDGVTFTQLGQLVGVSDIFGGSLPGPSGSGVLAY